MAQGTLRMRMNMQCVGQNKLRRGSGWTKALSNPGFNNEDFHDQLLTFSGIRQPVTLLFEAESTRKVRNLIAAKQGAIAKLDENSGNWQILGSGFGGTPVLSAAAPRFKAAQEGDYLAFTNDFESPMYYRMEGGHMPGDPLLQPFTDLPLIGLTRAAAIWSWRNCLFLADVEMDNERFAHRLVWSDFDNPTGFDPANLQSITGKKDLYSHERILAGAPLGNSFMIYTTHGIWEMAVVGGEQSFAFQRRFDGENNEGASVLKYPNTLVNLPSAHFYLAEDGAYIFSPWSGQPERVEWLHRSIPIILDNIDQDNCQVHVAGFHSNELYISTASTNALNNCPERALRVHMTYRVADKIDFGFTALTNYRSFAAPTIRDFIVENAICTIQGLADEGYPYVNEGLPSPALVSSAPFVPDSFWTTIQQTFPATALEAAKVPTTIARTSNVATMTIAGHGYNSNDVLIIGGMSDASFNSSNAVITVTGADTFTYPSMGPNVAPTNASAPFVRKIDTPFDAAATVEVDGTAIVKATNHGLITGNHIRISAVGGGNPVLNSESVAVVVADADTFNYATAGKKADTSFGAPNIRNLVAGGIYAVTVVNTNPSKFTVIGMTSGGIYKFTPGLNGDQLFLIGPSTTLATETYFVYDGGGATLLGPNVWNSVDAYAVNDVVVDIVGGITTSYVCTHTRSATATHPGDDIGHWTVTDMPITLDVTAIISPGLDMRVSKVEAIQVPTSVSRNDALNPDWATITLTAHGYVLNNTVQIGGFSDPTFNARDTLIVAKTANTFSYVAMGAVVTPENPTNIQVRRVVSSPIVTEDWNQPTADADSLCALLGNTRIDDFCRKCEGQTLLLGASSEDWCIKQIGGVFYRERCANPAGVGTTTSLGYQSSIGSFILDGYDSIIRTAPAYAKKMLLQLDELRIEYLARMVSEIGLRVGIASQVADPNTDECCIVWFIHENKPLACLTAKTPAQHAATGTIPSRYAHWKLLRKGRVLCLELKISGTGGDADFSGLEGEVKALETQRF